MSQNKQIIYLKYGELCLKGKNIKTFKKQAFKNLKQAIAAYPAVISQQYDSVSISDFDAVNLDFLLELCKRMPGYSYCTVAYVVDHDMDSLLNTCLLLIGQAASFKISTTRKDKSYPLNSHEINCQLGGLVLDKLSIKVDIHHPAVCVNIEIKQQHAVVFGRKLKTIGGLPISCSGRGLLLLSGGIDSPVAGHQLLKKGLHVDFITFITPPHTSEQALEKVYQLVAKISMDYQLYQPCLYVCNYTPILNELSHLSVDQYNITILRRSFLRISNLLADKFHYDCLATGDSLGQVASQTIESLSVIDQASKRLILRPLICFDKQEIINIAKEINTYEISILPFADACSLFVPAAPTTKPKLPMAEQLEQEIVFLNELENTIINNIKVFTNADKK